MQMQKIRYTRERCDYWIGRYTDIYRNVKSPVFQELAKQRILFYREKREQAEGERV